jgi:hypothetical protein
MSGCLPVNSNSRTENYDLPLQKEWITSEDNNYTHNTGEEEEEGEEDTWPANDEKRL